MECKNKIFYLAYTCNDNAGDLLITKMQIEEYAKYGAVYIDATGMPSKFKEFLFSSKNDNIKDFTKEYGCKYRGIGMYGVIKLLKRNDFTHFTKSPGPYAILKLPLVLLLKRIIGATGYAYARRKGLKIFVMGIDLDYSNVHYWLKQLNIRYFNIYNRLFVRSLRNQELLQGELHNISYIPDMAFLLGGYVQNRHFKKEKRVAFSFREITEMDSLIEKLRTISEFFIERGYKVDILYQVQRDRNVSIRLSQNIGGTNLIGSLIWIDNLDYYSKYEFVFSNRLHVLLSGAVYNAIPIALISNDIKEQKIDNIYKSSLDTRWLFHLNEVLNLNTLLDEREYDAQKIISMVEKQNLLCKRIIKNYFN